MIQTGKNFPRVLIWAYIPIVVYASSERLIYKTLTPEYKRDYESAPSAEVEDNKAIEEDSKKVAQNYNIDVKEDIPDSPIYHRLQEKIQMLEDERDYYKDERDRYKGERDYYNAECNRLKERIKTLESQLQLTN